MLPDTVVILGVVLLNAVLGFLQEGKAESALEALENLTVASCTALRDGRAVTVPAWALVPGDVVSPSTRSRPTRRRSPVSRCRSRSTSTPSTGTTSRPAIRPA
jgi:hypothetical protein